mmetsp:Transcript_15698/g.26329  ORF Transcript_15698/g.26329 Transcript_15698/m.26329 type:complete len:176 (+) Transcript_15698:41-568(+)
MSFWKPGTSRPAVENSTTGSQEIKSKNVEKGSNRNSSQRLSSGVLNMKFMKKKELLASNNTSSKATHPVVLASQESLFIKDELDCAASLPGRRSFNGCNKAVEKHYDQMMETLNYKTKISPHKASEDDIALLKKYENLVGLPRGPNQGKKRPNGKVIRCGNEDREGLRGKKKKLK